jgi:hypothetical protein
MAKKPTQSKINEDSLRDIYDLTQETGTTRADMRSTLEDIAELCTTALPDLIEGDEDEDEDGDEESDEDDEE